MNKIYYQLVYFHYHYNNVNVSANNIVLDVVHKMKPWSYCTDPLIKITSCDMHGIVNLPYQNTHFDSES